MTQSKVVLTQRPTIPFVAPNTLVLYVQNDALYMKDDEQEIFLVGPVTTQLAAIQAETDKIDSATTDGLLGEDDSLAYRIAEVEHHIHSTERWWGAVGAPDETNAIDANVDTPFVATSGNDTWGTAIPICGTGDNPVLATDVKYDAHMILVTDTDHSTPYRIRFIYGTGTSAAAISAGQWSEGIFITAGGPFSSGVPAEGRMPRVDVGTKLWVQVWNATNASTVSFFWGAHGYPG